MSGDSFLIDPDHAELFDGPKNFTVTEYAAIRLSAGRHTITLTSERPFLIAVIPASETPE
jgi:hypothetical protein